MSANYTPGNILSYNPTSVANYNAGTATYNPPTPGTGVNWNSTTYYEVDKKISAPGEPLEYSVFSTTNYGSGYNLTCPVGESNFVTNSYNPGNIATYNPGNSNYFAGVAVYNTPSGGVTWNSVTTYEVEKKVSAPGEPVEYSTFVFTQNFASGFSPTCPAPEGSINPAEGGGTATYDVAYTCEPAGEPGNISGYSGNIAEFNNSTVATYNPGAPTGEGALYEVNYSCTPAGETPGNLTGNFTGNTIADYNPGSAATYNPPTITGYNPLTPGEAIYTPGNIASYNEGFAVYTPGNSLGFAGNNANYNPGSQTYNPPIDSGYNAGGNPATYNTGNPAGYNAPNISGYNPGSISGYTGNNAGGFTGNNIATYTGNNANYNSGSPASYNPTNISGYNPPSPSAYNLGSPASYTSNFVSGYNAGVPSTYTGNNIGSYSGNFAATYNPGSPANYNPPIPGTPGDQGYAFGVYFPGGGVCAPGTYVSEQEISYYFEGQEIDYKNHDVECPPGGQIVVRIE